jgi:hypothetical protein
MPVETTCWMGWVGPRAILDCQGHYKAKWKLGENSCILVIALLFTKSYFGWFNALQEMCMIKGSLTLSRISAMRMGKITLWNM